MSELTTNLNNILSIKGDIKTAIESKGVDMTGVSFPDYANKIGEIPVGGTMGQLSVLSNGTYTPPTGIDGWDMVTVDVPQSVTGFTQKEITEGIRLTELSNSASSVHPYVFEMDSYLISINLPNCSIIGTQAFKGCDNLRYISLPNCSYLGESCFYGCIGISEIYLPECTYLSQYAFAYCRSLRSINLPKITYIHNSVFVYCDKMTTVNLPSCLGLDSYAFGRCSMLQTLNLPECSCIGDNALDWCINLRTLSIPKCESLGEYALRDCSQLTELNLPVLSFMTRGALYNVPLTTLILGSNSVVSIGLNPRISDTCSIYVPASLVEEYKINSKWASYSSQIFPIE